MERSRQRGTGVRDEIASRFAVVPDRVGPEEMRPAYRMRSYRRLAPGEHRARWDYVDELAATLPPEPEPDEQDRLAILEAEIAELWAGR